MGFVRRKLQSPFPNSGSPTLAGAWSGDDTVKRQRVQHDALETAQKACNVLPVKLGEIK